MIGTFRIGADASIALDAVSGDVSIVTDITARMQRVSSNTGNLTGPMIPLNVAPRAASGSFPAGWNITVPASVTSTLRPGNYAIDAELEGIGFVQVTETSAIIAFTQGAI